MLELAKHGAGLHGTLHFNTDLFDKATAHRMLGHYMVSWLSRHPKVNGSVPQVPLQLVSVLAWTLLGSRWCLFLKLPLMFAHVTDCTAIGVEDLLLSSHKISLCLGVHCGDGAFTAGCICFMQELLHSAAASPGTQVSRLNLITPPEVMQVLKGFNAWDLPYTDLLNPETQIIHGMFEHWAKHTPEAPALNFGVTPAAHLTCLHPLP